jgi:HPt (histidine-containing phosphotransfer) domain-containing protein
LPRFIARRERDVSTLQAALEAEDFRVIETLGHNMRGNGISYGFPDISAIGACLESAAQARSHSGVRQQLAALGRWIDLAHRGEVAGANRRPSGVRPKASGDPGSAAGGGDPESGTNVG